MDNVWLISGIGTAGLIIMVLIALYIKRSKKGGTSEEIADEAEDYDEGSGEEYDEDDEPETEPEIKRGVLLEKDCFVDKDGTFIPDGAERSRVCFFVRIQTTDGAEEEYVVDEQDYTSVEEGQAVTYMKQGTKFLGFGVDIDKETEETEETEE